MVRCVRSIAGDFEVNRQARIRNMSFGAAFRVALTQGGVCL